MSAAPAPKPPAPVPDDSEVPQGFELVDGDLIEKETTGEHARAQVNIATSLSWPFGRRGAGGPPERPGGWWFATEALIQFGPGKKYRPDVAGWRRDKLQRPPAGELVTDLPHWICEIISPTNVRHDTIRKMWDYHQAQVGHYWLLDPRDDSLTVYRWTKDGFLLLLTADRAARVRAEPFQALELAVGVFFGDDET